MPPVPVLCLVTDRRRASPTAEPGALVEQATRAAEAGIDFIQLRERDLEGAALADLAAALVAAVRGSRTRILVNDRTDVALAVGAAGVHLRGESVPCPAVRAIAPAAFLVGRSVHDVEAARCADADFLIAGTLFPTVSKTGPVPLLGDAGLRAIVRAVPQPVLAIGGISIDRVAGVAAAGAAGIAAVGLFLGPSGPAPLGEVVTAIQREFARHAPLHEHR